MSAAAAAATPPAAMALTASLAGKVALVTGAAGAIGAAISRSLQRAGSAHKQSAGWLRVVP